MKRLASMLSMGDVRLLYYMNHTIRCGVFDRIVPFITHLGGAVFTISFTLSLIIFGNVNVQKMGWEVAASLSSSHLIVHLLKRKVNRPRPHTVLQVIEKFEVPICDYSFPSGHTTASFAVANILAMHLPGLSGLILGGAVLVGLSRMYLGVHYPSDVLVGFGVALISSLLVHNWFQMIFV